MARSVQEIYDSIVAAKEAEEDLSGLNSVSNVARYKILFYVVAVVIYVHEVIFDNHKLEVETISAKGAYGTMAWWNTIIRSYQHGDLLTFNSETNTYGYAVIDPAKQIIKRVSIHDSLGTLVIKVAKISGVDVIPLSEPELNGLIDYIKELRPAGTRVQVLSLNADKLKVTADVYYEASGNLATIQTAVELAIVSYINNIPFDGVINRNELIDRVRDVMGVIDFDPTLFQAKVGANPYVTIGREYQAVAGYFEIDEDFLLSNTLTYKT